MLMHVNPLVESLIIETNQIKYDSNYHWENYRQLND